MLAVGRLGTFEVGPKTSDDVRMERDLVGLFVLRVGPLDPDDRRRRVEFEVGPSEAGQFLTSPPGHRGRQM